MTLHTGRQPSGHLLFSRFAVFRRARKKNRLPEADGPMNKMAA